MRCSVGIDIGGTNFRIGIVNENGEISNFEKNSSMIFQQGDPIVTLYNEINDYLIRTNMADKISAIAIGLPSMVSKDKKTVYSTPNIKGFDNIDIGDPLTQKLGIPVFVDRDVNFLLQSDIASLNIEDTQDKTILGFYIGTGLGNALFINGKFHYGKNGVAGELGHTPSLDFNEHCPCGNEGCAELRCSGKYLEKICQQYFSQTKISQVFKYHKDEQIIKKYVADLAIPLATEINILDPDYIIIAGGVVYMEDFPIDDLIKSIKHYARKPYPANNLQILFSRHNQQSGIYGSGTYALNATKN